MNWLAKIGRRAKTESAIEIPYMQCEVVLGKGAYTAHNHIFVNPDPKSALVAVIITCDDDPNVSAELLSRQNRQGTLSRFMLDQGLCDRRMFPAPYRGGYPEIPAALEKMAVSYEAIHPLDSFRLHESIPGRPTSFYAGTLSDPRVQARTVEKMRGLLDVIATTDLVSENPRIRAAMIDKMREELSHERHLAIGSGLFVGHEQENGQKSNANCVRPPQISRAIPQEGPVC